MSACARMDSGQPRRRSAYAMTAALLLAVLSLTQPALAADPRHPDWPCAQIKVPELSVAAVWAGPPIDDVGNAWEEDAKIRDAVARLAARRTPLDQAQQAVAELITGDAAEKQAKAKLLFAGLFDTLSRQRGEVMAGIERFSRRQRDFAERIRANTLAMRALEDAGATDKAKIEELGNQIVWDTRIFEDRRRTTRYVCEVPTLIEQRLFALARAIAQAAE
jgi:hypothetical protein